LECIQSAAAGALMLSLDTTRTKLIRLSSCRAPLVLSQKGGAASNANRAALEVLLSALAQQIAIVAPLPPTRRNGAKYPAAAAILICLAPPRNSMDLSTSQIASANLVRTMPRANASLDVAYLVQRE